MEDSDLVALAWLLLVPAVGLVLEGRDAAGSVLAAGALTILILEAGRWINGRTSE